MTSLTARRLATPRLELTALRVDDAEAMVDVLNDVDLYSFTGGGPPDLTELRARYRAQVEGPQDGRETWLNWIVRLAANGSEIGFVQSTVVGATASVAWLVSTTRQGQGFATESASAVCRWLISQGIAELNASIHPEHHASMRVAAKLGMVQTGQVDDDGEYLWRMDGAARRPIGGRVDPPA